MAEPTPPHSVAVPARAGAVAPRAGRIGITGADTASCARAAAYWPLTLSISTSTAEDRNSCACSLTPRSTGGWLARFARGCLTNMSNGATSPISRSAHPAIRFFWRRARRFSAGERWRCDWSRRLWELQRLPGLPSDLPELLRSRAIPPTRRPSSTPLDRPVGRGSHRRRSIPIIY